MGRDLSPPLRAPLEGTLPALRGGLLLLLLLSFAPALAFLGRQIGRLVKSSRKEAGFLLPLLFRSPFLIAGVGGEKDDAIAELQPINPPKKNRLAAREWAGWDDSGQSKSANIHSLPPT